ncbi:MAG: 50S ribosomal protein L18 [Candidatus Dasytiphilus stammeri]
MYKKSIRLRRAARTRNHLKKLNTIRLVINRTPRHIYAQIIISALSGSCEVLIAASTLEKHIKSQLINTGNKTAAEIVGKLIAERALKKGIRVVSFDRSGFLYHGRIQALADAARSNGLKF